ncbi:MAG TPA: ABC transporter ATP-binding protein [Planctomycetota bacterium]|nr:ABC transporter ATP-binding protein [Planctomycetota bacterium]
MIRRLLAFAWSYRGPCIAVLVIQCVLIALGLSGLHYSGLYIDYLHHLMKEAKAPAWPMGVAPPADWPALAVVGAIGGGVLVMAGTRGVLNYVYSIMIQRLLNLRVVPALRAQVYDKLQRLSFAFFDANGSGSLINRVTGDVQLLRSFIDGVLLHGVIMTVSLTAYLVLMARTNVGLTIACLATTPLLYLASATFTRWVGPMYQKNRELQDRLIGRLSESVQGIHVVKGFARESEERALFAAINAEVRDQQRRIFWRVSLFTPAMEMLTQLNLVILLGYGGWLAIEGRLSTGELFVFSGLLQQFSGQVSSLAGIANTVQQSLIGAKRVFEILDAPVAVETRPDPVTPAQVRGAVRFERVSFGYKPDEPVLHDIDLDVKPGSCIAVLGATGSGKTTLMNLIPRFYDPTAGRVLIDGVDARDLEVDALRRSIGLVFQESFLFSNTIAANIAFGHPEASREQIVHAATIAAAHRFICELPKGYDTVLGESGVNLSGGQRQRLAIARAVLLEPSILLLDDPTAAIDPQTEHEILEAMDNAIAGRTTFIVAHRLSTLRRADLVIVLEKGRIVERGTHDELMRAGGHYLKAAELQVSDPESLRALDAARPGAVA